MSIKDDIENQPPMIVCAGCQIEHNGGGVDAERDGWAVEVETADGPETWICPDCAGQ